MQKIDGEPSLHGAISLVYAAMAMAGKVERNTRHSMTEADIMLFERFSDILLQSHITTKTICDQLRKE